MQRLRLEDKTQTLRFCRVGPKVFAFKTLSNDDVSVDVSYPPKLKMYRWGRECSLTIWLDQNILPLNIERLVSLEGDRLKYITEPVELHFYPLNPTSQNELGGVEFEVVLKRKPSVNKLVFRIETENLKFYYQPPLTPQEIARGCIRPENVVGSYAVYHASRTNMHRSQADAEKYKAGKAFHIYRPKATDSVGTQVWCDIHVDENKRTLIITIPQEFLDKAVYPVSVDPTFGYTTIGGSREVLSYSGGNDYIRGSLFTLTESAIADSMTVYIVNYPAEFGSVSGKLKAAVYLHSNLSLKGSTGEITVSIPTGTTGAWKTTNFAAPKPSLPPDDYVLVAWADEDLGFNDMSIAYDAGVTNQGHYQQINYSATWPDPLVPTHNNNKYSIYCTYTVAAKTVTATDACSFADPFAFYRGKYQTLLDHYGFLDALSTSRLYARLVLDASAFGDIGVFVRTKLIYPLDALGLADSYFSSELFMRWFSDDLAFADLIQTFRLKFLPLSEYASLKDSVFSSLVFNRYFSDFLSLKDLAETFRAYSRSLTEAFSIYDLTSLLKTKPVYFKDVFEFSDLTVLASFYFRVFLDFYSLGDVLSKFVGRYVWLYLAEASTLRDDLSLARILNRYLEDFVNFEDSVWLARLKFISYADSFSLYDLALPVKWKILQFLEASLYGEIFETRRLYSRSFVEALSLFDLAVRYGFHRLLFADYFSMADQTFKFMAYARSFLEAFYAYDSWQKSQIMHKFFAESIVLGDVYSKSKSMKLLLEETFKLLDLVDRMLIRYVVAPPVWKTEAQYLEGILPIYKTIAKYLEGTGG
jgi:hypothetical protein